MEKITRDNELWHMFYLLKQIQDEGWVDGDTILVNVSPLYSSYLTQFMNHQLSGRDFHEMLNLELPQEQRSQVWNSEDAEFQPFERYLFWWTSKYIQVGTKYLFLANSSFSPLQRVRNVVRTKIGHEFFRFATLVSPTEGFQADFKSIITDLPTVFEWENNQHGK